MNNKCYVLWVCVCSLRYPACNAHGPYCHLWRLALPYFSTLSHKQHDFRKKVLNMKSVLWFSLKIWPETFSILRRTEREMIKIYIGLHIKYRLLLSDFNENFNFRCKISKNSHISNFMKIRPMAAELWHADGQTHMTELTDAFHNFAKAPKETKLLTQLRVGLATYQ